MKFLWQAAILSSLCAEQVIAWRDAVRPKEKLTTSEDAKPWVRTIYGTKVEIVTPTVIHGITFSARPAPTPNPLEPWVSLQKDGTPKTIQPKIKNGVTKDGKPDYSTYFKTMSIKTYGYEDLKAHNMDPDDHYEEEIFIDEDDTYVSLNPVIRCTPKRYFNKGVAKDISSEPFCTPREDVNWKAHNTYFVTWYTRFFDDEHTGKSADKVRIHLSYVKEKSKEKGFHKREIPATFYSSEWIGNVDGIFPLTVQEEWLQEKYERRVVLSVQPDSIPDDEFDPLEHGVLMYIILGSKVYKHTKEELALEDAGISKEKWYYVAMLIPSLVMVSFAGMYFFLYLNKRNRDFSDITQKALNQKRRVLGKVANMKKFKNMKNHTYSELPIHKKTSKQN